jgi:hypothetical protein
LIGVGDIAGAVEMGGGNLLPLDLADRVPAFQDVKRLLGSTINKPFFTETCRQGRPSPKPWARLVVPTWF